MPKGWSVCWTKEDVKVSSAEIDVLFSLNMFNIGNQTLAETTALVYGTAML